MICYDKRVRPVRIMPCRKAPITAPTSPLSIIFNLFIIFNYVSYVTAENMLLLSASATATATVTRTLSATKWRIAACVAAFSSSDSWQVRGSNQGGSNMKRRGKNTAAHYVLMVTCAVHLVNSHCKTRRTTHFLLKRTACFTPRTEASRDEAEVTRDKPARRERQGVIAIDSSLGD